jgi:sigma-B regulation protein RsbU (phosphoserine phosphatase)
VALFGVLRLFRGFDRVDFPLGLPFIQVAIAMPTWADGTFALILSLLLLNFLVLLEVADRLSLKGELEVAREIQLAMLPAGTLRAADVEICGLTRPANTVGGDFYDVLPLADGRLILTLGDVAGKGSPAALLMALLLAVLRTLVDEGLEAPDLMRRLNLQICRHSPGSRFITLFYAEYSPSTGRLVYVNAGQTPPLIRRRDGTYQRLEATGIALGMFEGSTYVASESRLDSGDMLVAYSDGITEAESPTGQPFEETGLEGVLTTYAAFSAAELGTETIRAVERHARDSRFSDDLTMLVMKRQVIA